MSSRSDSSPNVPFEDTGAFELTDLGACSYLDEPVERKKRYLPRSLTDNISACVTSRPPRASESRPLVRGREPVAPARRGEPQPVPRRRRTETEDQPTRVHVSTLEGAQTAFLPGGLRDPSGQAPTVPPSESGPMFAARPAIAPLPEAPPSLVPEPRTLSQGSRQDRLDAALRDFIGDESDLMREDEALERIYGAVFDPEQREREHQESELRSIGSGPFPAVSQDEAPSFSWDADALDEPIDPDDVRRRVGVRADGVPQFAVLRRQGQARAGDPEDER